MKRKRFIKTGLFVLLLPFLLLTACRETAKKKTAATEKQQTYTCSMHPQIMQHKPGTCPICGMDLVLFDKNNKETFLTLSESQIALANITTRIVGTGTFSNYKQLNGRLVVNPERTTVIASRVAGRIEKLFVRETGIKVNKGQPLYKIYAEQLASLQQEYLLAVAQVKQFPDDTRFQQIEKAARQKLMLYGQSATQVNQLLQSQKVDPYITGFAASSGVVAELSVTEGQYVAEGSKLMQLEDYHELWVEADVYPDEASMVHTGQQVKVVIAGYENLPQTMRVQFITPAVQSGSQLMQLRGTIANTNNKWQPGAQVNVLLPAHNKDHALSLPVDAVLRDAQGAHIWLAKAAGKFEPRMVKTGAENFDAIEIIDGLYEGDTVVVSGAYLLYSEYLLKKGADPMAGMKGMHAH